jgi:hypothetical protein
MPKSMRLLRLSLFAILAAALVTAAYLTLRGFDLLGAPGEASVKRVPQGHQEVAFLIPATGGETWERLVAALDALKRDWSERHPRGPQLLVRKDNAFVELTADVAQLALWLEGRADQKLWIRWYKLTSENTAERWVEKLAQRHPPPLAVIGGDISDRALALALTMEAHRGKWQGRDPLLVMTTATADRYSLTPSPNEDHTGEHLPKLINVYRGRSFRFSFTNKHMARVVLEFIRDHPEVWPANDRHAVAAAACTAAAADGWAGLNLLAASELSERYVLHTLAWRDDRYSLDLAARTRKVFPEVFRLVTDDPNEVAYSAGDYYNPNPREALVVRLFLSNNRDLQAGRHLLALPTNAQRAQRVMRTLVRRDPVQARNLVMVTGDSISFNSIYRDRNVSWSILDMPVSLVLFAHRNPINAAVGFRAGGAGEAELAAQAALRVVEAVGFRAGGAVEAEPHSTATDDLLLHRDILEALVQAAYSDRELLADADALNDRLHGALWKRGQVEMPGFAGAPPDGNGAGVPLFDADGNRSPRTGEHVVWLRPGENPAQATITVWRRRPEGAPEGDGWVPAGGKLQVSYDTASAQGRDQ